MIELNWSNIPISLLQHIYSLLEIKNRGRCSQVCRHWYYVFETDYPWKKFIFRDHLLVRRRFTQHNGWQYALDHMRLRMVVPLLIHRWRELIFEPVENIFNLYEFMMKLAHYSEYQERFTKVNPLKSVRKFEFSWKLQVQTNDRLGNVEEMEIGTGGEILRSLIELLNNLSGLKKLHIRDLQLSYMDAELFLAEILELFQEKLVYLSLINITRHYNNNFIHIGLFVNLRSLDISCDLLNDTVIILLADLKLLAKIKIIQDEKCDGNEYTFSYSSWRDFKKANRNKTQITLVMRGKCKRSMIIQPYAPVSTIIWERQCGSLTDDLSESIITNYSLTLKKFVQVGLERHKRNNHVSERIDKALVNLFIRCSNLEYLSIRERMSNGTALIIALLAANRQCIIHFRKNALLKRLSWTSIEIHHLPIDINIKWIKAISHDYDKTFNEISKITKSTRSILNDKLYIDYI